MRSKGVSPLELGKYAHEEKQVFGQGISNEVHIYICTYGNTQIERQKERQRERRERERQRERG